MTTDTPGACILTGAAGENPDDCHTHEHEATDPRGTHTPGPWGYVHHKGLDQHLVGPTGENVAIIEDRHGNAEANARLIASAPALLAAVEALIITNAAITSEIETDEIDRAHDLGRAAIDAATGGQS